MSDTNIVVPQAGVGDTVHVVISGGLSAIPVVGGPIEKFVSHVFPPPLNKRIHEFHVSVADELNKQNIRIEQLENHQQESFAVNIIRSDFIVAKTRSIEKLKTLRNAVINSVGPTAPVETMQEIFFSHIDQFSELHIRVLKHFESPDKSVGTPDQSNHPRTGPILKMLDSYFPELLTNQGLGLLIWNDLVAKGFINRMAINDPLNAELNSRELYAKRVTNFGEDFLRFISEYE